MWMPGNLTETGQMILAVPTSPTQRMDRFLLELAVVSKIAQMAEQEDLDDAEVLAILSQDPDLQAAIGPMTETRPMAEAALMAENLSNLIFSADMTSAPVKDPELWQIVNEQLLSD
jgi:hypothetical protein